ncbi:MAG: response regulator [Oscillospiraceae bacterium]|nr:response regulator [Oscillospiraceae bacterium]
MNTISILLVEDDEDTCKIFEDYIKTRTDVVLVGITNSSLEALEYTKRFLPNAIILDLELHERIWLWL